MAKIEATKNTEKKEVVKKEPKVKKEKKEVVKKEPKVKKEKKEVVKKEPKEPEATTLTKCKLLADELYKECNNLVNERAKQRIGLSRVKAIRQSVKEMIKKFPTE